MASPTSHVVPRPLVLIVMDGYGINPRTDANAIALAREAHLDAIAREWPHTQVATSGPAVGLPEGQMGNSEVGHLNIGAGKRVLQEFTRVTAAIARRLLLRESGAAQGHRARQAQQQQTALLRADRPRRRPRATRATSKPASSLPPSHDVERVYIHAFTDGRDTSPFGAEEYMNELWSPEPPKLAATTRPRSPPSLGATTRWTATTAGIASPASTGR